MSQEKIVIFSLEGQRYALHLGVVERIVRAVEITPLPEAPEIVQGIINIEGRVIPVLDIRQRFRLPERSLEISDQFIIAETRQRAVALLVDNVINVTDYISDEVIAADEISSGVKYISGVAKESDGLVLIHDIDTFLSLDEQAKLDQAIGH